jgi:uncharacterized coiled-coil protein SlyX
MITRADVGLLLGLAAFFLAGAAYYRQASVASRTDLLEQRMKGLDEVAIHDDEMQGQFAERITALEKKSGGGEVEAPGISEANLRISALQKDLAAALADVAEMRAQISGLAQRLQALEKPR